MGFDAISTTPVRVDTGDFDTLTVGNDGDGTITLSTGHVLLRGEQTTVTVYEDTPVTVVASLISGGHAWWEETGGEPGPAPERVGAAPLYRTSARRSRVLPLPIPPVAVTEHPDPPTVTLSAASAATSIVGGTDRPADSEPFRFTGTRMVAVDPEDVGDTEGALTSIPITTPFPPHQWQVEFVTDADEIEIVWQCVTNDVAGYRLWVDGHPLGDPETGIGIGGAFYRTHIDFTTRALRTVKFEAVWARFIGVTAHPAVSIQPPTRRVDPVCVVLGDSFTEGIGADWVWTGWAQLLGSNLGWDVHQLGVGGTGYVNDGDTEGKTVLAGRVVDIHPDAEIIVVAGGYNDDQQDPDEVSAAARSLYSAIQAGWPTAELIVVSNFASTAVTEADERTDVRDAIRAEADHAGVPFIDVIRYPGTPLITGTGKVGDTEGDGNADFYISADGVHPSPAGHEYLARSIAGLILAAYR